METTLSLEQKEKIVKTIEELKKKNPTLKRIFPIVVFGDEYDDKDLYVAYFKRPSAKEYSKWLSLMKKDESTALKALAKDCFIDGDKDLIDNEDLFLFGTIGQLSSIMESRQAELINF